MVEVNYNNSKLAAALFIAYQRAYFHASIIAGEQSTNKPDRIEHALTLCRCTDADGLDRQFQLRCLAEHDATYGRAVEPGRRNATDAWLCVQTPGLCQCILASSVRGVVLVFFETEHSLLCHIVGGGSMLTAASQSMNFLWN
jgi:hypothetical protein